MKPETRVQMIRYRIGEWVWNLDRFCPPYRIGGRNTARMLLDRVANFILP